MKVFTYSCLTYLLVLTCSTICIGYAVIHGWLEIINSQPHIYVWHDWDHLLELGWIIFVLWFSCALIIGLWSTLKNE